MKVYEFTGYRKYSCCIAAESEDAAIEKAKELSSNWLNKADEVGCEELDTDDISDIRDIPEGDDITDYAHVTA